MTIAISGGAVVGLVGLAIGLQIVQSRLERWIHEKHLGD
jgi:hypothetical protein